MAEEVKEQGVRRVRRRLRLWLTLSAAGSVVVVLAATIYLTLPEVVVGRALQYETYPDATGLTLGLEEFEQIYVVAKRYKDMGRGGGWPKRLNPDGPLILISATYVVEKPDAEQGSSAWAILDTDQEKFVGSLRLQHRSVDVLGIRARTTVSIPPLWQPSGVYCSISCNATLPDWWPGRERWGEQGAFVRATHVRFDAENHNWEPRRPGSDGIAQHVAWFNRKLSLLSSSDELIAEHDFANQKGVVSPIFRRLVRRSREDGRVRWEVTAEQFPPVAPTEEYSYILIPPCPLDSAVSWCLLVQCGYGDQMQLARKLWKLNLESGQLVSVDSPQGLAPQEVCSDGQTALLTDLASWYVWHPEEGSRQLCRDLDASCLALPRGRVLLFARLNLAEQLKIEIVPLDGGEPRPVYP